LSYYSGLTFEATLSWHPSLGSIAGGGRYDHLASSLGSKDIHPGVGGSLGISRLFGSWCKDNPTVTVAIGDVFVTVQEPEHLHHYLSLAHQWRQEGWKVETCLEAWPLAKQMKYAHKKGYPIVIMANQEDVASCQVVIKHMASGEQVATSLAQAPALITQWLAQPPSAP
jgi:histidyl-tRNA synthetase